MKGVTSNNVTGTRGVKPELSWQTRLHYHLKGKGTNSGAHALQLRAPQKGTGEQPSVHLTSTAASPWPRLEEMVWSWQSSEQCLQSSRSGASAQQMESVKCWTGSPSDGQGMAALDRVPGGKETLNPTGAPVKEPRRNSEPQQRAKWESNRASCGVLSQPFCPLSLLGEMQLLTAIPMSTGFIK